MINAIDKPAIFIGEDYIIHAVNRAYSDTYTQKVSLGYSRCFEVSHGNTKPCDQCGEECPMREVEKTLKTSNVVHVHHTAKGESYCDIVMRPIFDPQGELLGYLEILDKIEFATHQAHDEQMLGVSDAFKSMLNYIQRAAKSDISVLLQGDTGTGKELVARALHDASARKNQAFVIIECTGLSESLFESELFGHEKGAFTGANTAREGLIDTANGGTVFFDEIGDVPLNQQVKLLRLLENGTYRSVGGRRQKLADIRVVCATHKDLKGMVERGEFRRDLYYRLAGFPIHLPSLNERKTDIPLLAERFLSRTSPDKQLSKKAINRLQEYDFPGNIRELRSVIEQAALMSDEAIIDSSDLPSHIQSSTVSKSSSPKMVTTLDDAEAEHIKTMIETGNFNHESLADALGVSVRTLYRKLDKHSLSLN